MKNLKKYKKQIIISMIVLIFIIVGVFIITKDKQEVIPTAEEKEVTKIKANHEITESLDLSFATYTASEDDTSALLIKDESFLALRNSTITKTGGKATDINKSDKYGINSALVISYNSTGKIFDTKVKTSTDNANAIFIDGTKAYGYIADSTIETLNFNSNGIVVQTAEVDIDHIILTTKVKESSGIVLNNKEAKVNIKNSMLETNGSLSPVIITNGNLLMDNTTITANGSYGIKLENGKTTITNSTILVNGANLENKNSSGIYLNTNKQETTLNIEKTSLNINQKFPYYNRAYMFDINNSVTSINLTDNQLNYGSNKLLNIIDSKVTLNTNKQLIIGDILIDNQSTLELNLNNSSSFVGSINSNNTIINLDESSSITLTKDTYIKELNGPKNIKLNGHKLYINNELYK